MYVPLRAFQGGKDISCGPRTFLRTLSSSLQIEVFCFDQAGPGSAHFQRAVFHPRSGSLRLLTGEVRALEQNLMINPYFPGRESRSESMGLSTHSPIPVRLA